MLQVVKTYDVCATPYGSIWDQKLLALRHISTCWIVVLRGEAATAGALTPHGCLQRGKAGTGDLMSHAGCVTRVCACGARRWARMRRADERKPRKRELPGKSAISAGFAYFALAAFSRNFRIASSATAFSSASILAASAASSAASSRSTASRIAESQSAETFAAK